MNFYMVYQPQFQNSKIVGIEALLRPEDKNLSINAFISSQPSKIALDINVIKKVIEDLKDNRLVKSVSINIHPSSLIDQNFVDECIELCSNLTYKVVLELVEYESYGSFQKIIDQIKYLKKNGVELTIDDFGKSFSNADTIINLPISKVKIDGSLVDNIENNSLKFKFLNFLNGIILDIISADIVFEKVENLRQLELIELINPQAIIQGYYFEKPMKIEELMLKYDENSFISLKEQEKEIKNDLFDFVFDYIKKNIDVNSTIYNERVNDIFKKHDKLKLTHNSDFNISWKNFMDSFLSRSSSLKNQFIRMINTKDRLVIVRNSFGVVVFDNLTHIDTVGMSLVGIDPKYILSNNSEYSMCILRDKIFLDSDRLFEVSQEYYKEVLFEVIREKIFYNDEFFIMASIYKSEEGELPMNKTANYSILEETHKSYIEKKALIVTFKELSSKDDLESLEKKIFNLYITAKTFKLMDGKYLFIPVVDESFLQEQLNIIVKNNSKYEIVKKEQITIGNDFQIDKYL